MNNKHTSRILTMSLVALVTLFFAGKTFASFNAYLQITDEKGTITKVDVAKDGSFTTPPLKEGRVKVQFFWDRSGSSAKGAKSASLNVSATPGGSAARESSAPSVSEIVCTYEVKAPRDVATGQASGKRQHKPITITKEWGASTPQLAKTSSPSVVVGDVTVDEDCDGITGKISFKATNGKTMVYDDWISSSN